MICPKCEYEYKDGIGECADCGAELIPTAEFEGKLVHPSDWVIVFTCSENYEAEMLKSNLEGAKIKSLILGQKDRSFPGVGDLAVIKLLVKKSDADMAVKIIEDTSKDK